MTIITDKITFGGKSLGKIDGKNVFIPYAIPGETLEIEIIEQKKDYDNAKITKIINPSEHRVKPICPYYEKCGGCNMMHIDGEYQKVLRKQILIDIYRQNGINIENITDVVDGPENNYRARFQLNDGGLSQKNSNVIVPVSNCCCAEKPINDYLNQTEYNNRPKGRIHLFGSQFIESSENLKITAESNNEQNNSSKRIQGKSSKKIKIKENHYFSGTVYSQENSITVKLADKKISFDVRGFFQSNLFVFEKVLKLIVKNLYGGKNILDMYSGCGSISTFLSDKYENVVMVEHNRDAIVYAEQNLSGKKHVSYGMSGAAWVKNCANYCEKFDACVVDPPRSGMEKEVSDYLCKSNIPQIISMSCDPATHARDCAKLIKAGYELKQMYLLDFYPNTSHIESLAIFSLNK